MRLSLEMLDLLLTKFSEIKPYAKELETERCFYTVEDHVTCPNGMEMFVDVSAALCRDTRSSRVQSPFYKVFSSYVYCTVGNKNKKHNYTFSVLEFQAATYTSIFSK